MKWQNIFEQVSDFRIERHKRYKLSDILMISVCAVISGADDFEAIAEYGREKQEFLKDFLDLPNGIPSHDTFNRVFRYMDKEAFGKVLHEWSKQLLAFLDFHQINIDGKVMRATAEGGKKKSGLCVVSAWVAEQRLVLGQEKVNKKSNEKTAIPQLIQALDLQGALVSIDAIACQVSIAKQITDKGGDYLLSLKKNQANLYEQVSEWMQVNKAQLPFYETVEESAGRFEQRRCYLSDQLQWMDDLVEWPAVKRVVMIESRRQKGEKIVCETRYYLSSLAENAFSFCALIRNHWSIENGLHWFLDVVFTEDKSRTRKDNGADNLSTTRKLALQIIRQTDDKHSVHHRRMKAAWNQDYLLQLLKNAFTN